MAINDDAGSVGGGNGVDQGAVNAVRQLVAVEISQRRGDTLQERPALPQMELALAAFRDSGPHSGCGWWWCARKVVVAAAGGFD